VGSLRVQQLLSRFPGNFRLWLDNTETESEEWRKQILSDVEHHPAELSMGRFDRFRRVKRLKVYHI